MRAMRQPRDTELLLVGCLWMSSWCSPGECGRVGVMGGSKAYTGAPYFAAMTALAMVSGGFAVNSDWRRRELIPCVEVGR